MNLSNTNATITLNVYAQNGAVIGTNTFGIAGVSSARTAMSGTTLPVGWAKAYASPPIELVATETIQLFSPTGALVMEASVLGAQS
jgi:hypothetical protein